MIKNSAEDKIVFVEWLDSISQAQVWFSPDTIRDTFKEPTDKIYTIAYLIHQNKKEYIFASSAHCTEDGVINFGKIFTIPKGCIVKIKKIKT